MWSDLYSALNTESCSTQIILTHSYMIQTIHFSNPVLLVTHTHTHAYTHAHTDACMHVHAHTHSDKNVHIIELYAYSVKCYTDSDKN